MCSWLVILFPCIQLLHFLFLSREAKENAELAKHRAERPKIQQQFADLKRGLSVVTDQEWESIPEVGNLTRKKRRKDDRSFAVPDSIIVGDRSKTEYENSLDSRQQQANGFETPADSGTMTNFVEIGQARDKILSLKLDQVRLFIILTAQYSLSCRFLGHPLPPGWLPPSIPRATSLHSTALFSRLKPKSATSSVLVCFLTRLSSQIPSMPLVGSQLHV